jgi:hypothetical protein
MARTGIHAPAASWRRVARGAVLGAAAALLDGVADRRGRSGVLGRIAVGAVLGAGYAAADRNLRLPPFATSLRSWTRTSDDASRAGPRAAPVRRRSRAPGRAAEPSRVPASSQPAVAPPDRAAVARKLHLGASALAFSVVADSSLEHYRGGFHNPAMYIAPVVSALTLLAAGRAAAALRRRSATRRAVLAAAAVTGLVGTGFHTYNVLRREGGLGWLNLFYGAPIAAPLGITFAGLFGLAATRLTSAPGEHHPRLLGFPAGAVLAPVVAMGLLGTAAEAGMLHFRGAFQDPFMYVPVVVPPLAGLALAAAAVRRERAVHRGARTLLWTTAAAGFAGMGFHAYGVHRNMGGWYNWTQMIQQGPPLPAPPSFTGMALAGLAALELLPGDHDG